MKPNDILCPMCDEVCGKYYPATEIDPGFCEGIGENFITVDASGFGVWHCSQTCLDEHIAAPRRLKRVIAREGRLRAAEAQRLKR
jgi:hypothetical protein